MTKQPTATKFTRTQESWAEFVLDKIEQQIKDRENQLAAAGVREDQWDRDPILMDLFDDELFYARYAEEMREQRRYIRAKYFGEEGND